MDGDSGDAGEDELTCDVTRKLRGTGPSGI